MQATRARLIADPGVTENIHEIDVRGAFDPLLELGGSLLQTRGIGITVTDQDGGSTSDTLDIAITDTSPPSPPRSLWPICRAKLATLGPGKI